MLHPRLRAASITAGRQHRDRWPPPLQSGAEGDIGVLTEGPRGKAVDLNGERTADVEGPSRQTVNELPQPQPPVATGLLNVNPEPIMLVT